MWVKAGILLRTRFGLHAPPHAGCREEVIYIPPERKGAGGLSLSLTGRTEGYLEIESVSRVMCTKGSSGIPALTPVCGAFSALVLQALDQSDIDSFA